MADVTLIRAGRWGLSRPLFIDGGWTTYAAEQSLGQNIRNYYPPRQADAVRTPACNAVLVHLTGTITPPSDGNTVLFPRNLDDLGDVTLGELTAAQRTAIRNTLETWLAGYTFTDWDGQQITIPPFTDRTATYTADTTLKQVARHIFKHFWHSTDRPKPRLVETHNTEYLDDFSTDPASRWTIEQGGAAWDSANDEYNINDSGADTLARYSANGPGSIEHEAQATFLNDSNTYEAGGGACRFDNTGVNDCYGACILDWSNQNQMRLHRYNAGVRSQIATLSSFTVADNDWVSMRMACSGTAGNSVVINLWMSNHGTSKPSDPGWYGTDGTPEFTHTDTEADRLDDAAHAHCGMAHRTSGVGGDSRQCFFKLRAISDRGGAPADPEGHLIGGKLIRGGLLRGGVLQ